jgi:hypothetical protein
MSPPDPLNGEEMSLPNGDFGLGGDTPLLRGRNGDCLASCGALSTLVNERSGVCAKVLESVTGCSYAALTE